jgi:TldD protein
VLEAAPFSALLAHGDFGDLYLEESATLALRWEESKIESVTRTVDSGAGLRFVQGPQTRMGHASLAAPFDAAQTKDHVARLQSIQQRLTSGLAAHPVPRLSGPSKSTHAIQRHPAQVPLREKTDLLTRAFHAANRGPHIRQVSINYGERVKRVACFTSEGQAYEEERVYSVFSITVTVERGADRQTAYDSLGGLAGFDLFEGGRVEQLARQVSARAHQKLNAPPSPMGEMPVVISSSAGGTLIHEAVGHSLEADAVLEGTSPSYVGKVGQVVANSKLTVYDDPTVAGARGSFAFDDEGTRSEATRLIENGVLKTFLYDKMSARRAGVASNGHGRRESYAHRPIPRMSNTFIAPGPDDPQAILSSFRDGFLVTKMGGGQVNTATGDFVFEVEEGYRVTDGKRQMVRGATLLGNGPETLKLIDRVGSDHGWAIGTCGKEGQGVPVSDAVPTIHIQKLVIGGSAA